MVGLSEVRDMAMALPGVEEGPPVRAARRIASFKVAGISFVGLENGGLTVTFSLAEEEAKAIAARRPDAYEEIRRNGKIMGLRADLSRVSRRRLLELIQKSWRHRVPKPMIAEFDRRAPR